MKQKDYEKDSVRIQMTVRLSDMDVNIKAAHRESKRRGEYGDDRRVFVGKRYRDQCM